MLLQPGERTTNLRNRHKGGLLQQIVVKGGETRAPEIGMLMLQSIGWKVGRNHASLRHISHCANSPFTSSHLPCSSILIFWYCVYNISVIHSVRIAAGAYIIVTEPFSLTINQYYSYQIHRLISNTKLATKNYQPVIGVIMVNKIYLYAVGIAVKPVHERKFIVSLGLVNVSQCLVWKSRHVKCLSEASIDRHARTVAALSRPINRLFWNSNIKCHCGKTRCLLHYSFSYVKTKDKLRQKYYLH